MVTTLTSWNVDHIDLRLNAKGGRVFKKIRAPILPFSLTAEIEYDDWGQEASDYSQAQKDFLKLLEMEKDADVEFVVSDGKGGSGGERGSSGCRSGG